MTKQKSSQIDYSALSKTLIIFGVLGLFLIITIYAPSGDDAEYESCEGTIIDKYRVLTEKSIFNNRAHYNYYLIVDCNGTYRTMHYYHTQLGEWSTKDIGDLQIVVWEVEK